MSSNTRFSTAWVQHIQDPDKRKDFEALVRNSTQVLSRLKEILDDREREMNNVSYSLNDFSDGNWAYKQAFRNGKFTALKEIKELLSFLGK